MTIWHFDGAMFILLLFAGAFRPLTGWWRRSTAIQRLAPLLRIATVGIGLGLSMGMIAFSLHIQGYR
jgi:hypothetical protein